MRRGLTLTALILLAVLTTPTMVTAADQVLDKWLYWDGSTTVDDHPVNVQLARNDEILRVDFLNKSTVTQKGGCGEINVYNFCFEETSEEENPDIDGEGQLRPGVKLKAYKEDITTVTDTGSPSMDISTNSTSLGVTDQQKIIVKFQNTGDGAMFNFSGSITPYNLTHEAGDDEDLVTVGDDTYKKTGGVEAGDNTTIPLTVSLDGFKPRLKATYAYDTSNGSSVTGTENITLQTETFYDVTLNAPGEAPLYTEQTITMTVQNNASAEMNADIALSHKGNQLFEVNDDNTNLSIPSDERRIVEATYVPRYEGTGTINAEASLDWGLTASETRNATITTPAPDVTVDGFIERANAGENTQVNITITNNERMMLYEPTATIRTPFGDIVKTLADNVTYNTRQKHTIPVELPLGIKPQAYDAEIIVRYTTKSNEQFKHEVDNSLIIEPVAYDVRLDKTFSDASPSLNETVHVEVYAENIGIEALNDLTVEETTTPTVYENTTEIDLEPDARLRIQEYNVSYNGTPITTTTRTDDDRLTVITTKTIDGEAPPEDQRNQTAVLPGATNETDDQRRVPPRNPPSQNQTEDEPDSAAGRIWSFLNDITTSLEDFFSSIV
jgi:hypothetical protein